MSTLKLNKTQIGISDTATNNFTLDASAANGTMKLARGNAGATTQDIFSVDAAGKISFIQAPSIPYRSGEVLQVLTFIDSGAGIVSNTLTNITNSNKTITPKSTNSTLIIECYFNGHVTAGGNATNTTGVFVLFDVEANTTINNEQSLGVVSTSGTNTQTQGICSIGASRGNYALTTRSFRLLARYTNASCTVGGYNHFWKITEVQN